MIELAHYSECYNKSCHKQPIFLLPFFQTFARGILSLLVKTITSLWMFCFPWDYLHISS